MTGLFFAYCSMGVETPKCRSLACYMFMQLVAPSAVTIAVATDAMICTINLSVSLLVIIL